MRFWLKKTSAGRIFIMTVNELIEKHADNPPIVKQCGSKSDCFIPGCEWVEDRGVSFLRQFAVELLEMVQNRGFTHPDYHDGSYMHAISEALEELRK